jgi:predicted ATP-binding protein involved in virulence
MGSGRREPPPQIDWLSHRTRRRALLQKPAKLPLNGSVMQINSLTVRNFRGFEEQRFEFHPQFNVLVGENGCGKSSVLAALCFVLGGWTGAFVTRHEFSSRNIRIKRFEHNDSITFERQLPVEITSEILSGESYLNFGLSLKSGQPSHDWATHVSSNHLLMLANDTATNVREGFALALPLIVSYPAARGWLPSTNAPWEQIMAEKPSRADGYADWLSPSNSIRPLIAWLGRQQVISLQEGRDTTIFSTIKKALALCFPEVQSIGFNIQEGDVIVEMEGKGSKRLSDLSDGQKNLFGMVGDIAIRIAKLNGHLGEQALAETSGVVLIDELDLHLHPRWQRRIVHDLRRAFPKIQFITATHSPQIIGEVSPEEVILLSPEGAKHASQAFGMDSNWVLRHLMDASPRDEEIDRQLQEIHKLIDEGEFEAARGKITELRRKIGDAPELVEAGVLMDRMEILAE